MAMKTKNFLVIGVVLVVIIFTVGIGFGLYNLYLTFQSNLVGTKTTMITSDTVIDKIEQVSELTTTKYTIQLVAKSETVGGWLLLGTTNVKMLLIAKGTVRAGLDLAKLDASGVIVSDDGKSVTVHLPQVKIFDRDQILNSNPSDTYVYDVQKGIAADTTNTETQLRGLANDQILEAACKDGIMEEATKNAKIVIEQLLKTFVTNVIVISAPVPSVDACKAK
jgi:hypothetical protein